jgi:hypothetical protein
LGELGSSSIEIRQKRERASNASLLLDQAREKLQLLEDAIEIAETEWLQALSRYDEMRASPPA